jgi:iron complex transport system permease protein
MQARRLASLPERITNVETLVKNTPCRIANARVSMASTKNPDPAAKKVRPPHRIAKIFFGFLVSLLVALAGISLASGAVSISLGEIIRIIAHQIFGIGLAGNDQETAVLWFIRFPRVIAAMMIGGSLALCGAVMQGMFRNPLADPGILGVSSGGALGAVILLVCGSTLELPILSSAWLVSFAAFGGSLLVTFLVMVLSRREGKTVVPTMLLAGIALSALCQAGVGLCTFVATDAQIRTITFWSMGSLGGATWSGLAVVAVFTLLPAAYLLRQGRALNALTLGESEAGHLGVPVEALKLRLVIACAILAGTAVAFAGLIGFIGLVVPHLIRLVIGCDHRWLLPNAALLGANLMLVADLLCRTIVAPAELPVGILTALAGAPFFIWLLVKQPSYA